VVHAADENVKKTRQSTASNNRLASTSYDNDEASGSRKYDYDDDDDETQRKDEFLDIHDEFEQNHNNSTNRKRRGTTSLML